MPHKQQHNIMRVLPLVVVWSLIAAATRTSAYSTDPTPKKNFDQPVPAKVMNRDPKRRDFLRKVATGAEVTLLSFGFSADADADDAYAAAPGVVEVYFGGGCFWHIQHEFVEAERRLLKRSDTELTSRAGYAGGKKPNKDGLVCYHNGQNIADYGKLGYGEVVGMRIPESSIGDFAKEYFSLYPNGERVDPGDRGLDYRSLFGLPGGTSHPMYPQVLAAAKAHGMTIAAGKGNDPDTLGKKMAYVMDSTKFPFFQAEVYHQFHNDFQSPAYGAAYNDLVKSAFEDGRVIDSGCPDTFP